MTFELAFGLITTPNHYNIIVRSHQIDLSADVDAEFWPSRSHQISRYNNINSQLHACQAEFVQPISLRHIPNFWTFLSPLRLMYLYNISKWADWSWVELLLRHSFTIHCPQPCAAGVKYSWTLWEKMLRLIMDNLFDLSDWGRKESMAKCSVRAVKKKSTYAWWWHTNIFDISDVTTVH